MLDLQLKELTREEHVLLEKEFMKIIESLPDREGYLRLLTRIYGFYLPVEAALMQYLNSSPVIDYEERIKSDKIRSDIRSMTHDIDDVQICEAIPAIGSFHSAIGVLYVLEGSTLGGQIIARILQAKLNLHAGLTFFLSYGTETPSMWNRFKSYLLTPFTPEQEEEIVSAAVATFRTYKNWLVHHE
jgi:heme oxygenase (biliverdin-IX-beta and delta-forming)